MLLKCSKSLGKCKSADGLSGYLTALWYKETEEKKIVLKFALLGLFSHGKAA